MPFEIVILIYSIDYNVAFRAAHNMIYFAESFETQGFEVKKQRRLATSLWVYNLKGIS